MDYEEVRYCVSRVRDMRDLAKFGIQILTGESCGLGMRYLCDLNARGRAILEEFFGGSVNTVSGSNWNSEVNGEPAEASIMLSPNILPDLAAFCMLKSGFDVAAVHVTGADSYAAVGFRLRNAPEGTTVEAIMKALGCNQGPGFRIYRNMGTAGTRNMHEMSGRVA